MDYHTTGLVAHQRVNTQSICVSYFKSILILISFYLVFCSVLFFIICNKQIYCDYDAGVSHAAWKSAIECISVVDVLIAMSHYSRHGDGGAMCRPSFVRPNNDAQVSRAVLINVSCRQ